MARASFVFRTTGPFVDDHWQVGLSIHASETYPDTTVYRIWLLDHDDELRDGWEEGFIYFTPTRYGYMAANVGPSTEPWWNQGAGPCAGSPDVSHYEPDWWYDWYTATNPPCNPDGTVCGT